MERIVGHGVDLVEVERVQRLLATRAEDFLASFSENEINAADPEPNRALYFAGRFAGKEAVAKGLGTGFTNGVAWIDVEIVRLESGAASVSLSGAAAERAKQLGVTKWLVSLSRSSSVVVASVLAVATSQETSPGT